MDVYALTASWPAMELNSSLSINRSKASNDTKPSRLGSCNKMRFEIPIDEFDFFRKAQDAEAQRWVFFKQLRNYGLF